MPETIAVNPQTGERVRWTGSAWVPAGPPAPQVQSGAPGAAYLPRTQQAPDKSEAAYFRQWRDKDNTALAGARAGVGLARRAEGLIARQEAQGQGTGGIYSWPVVGGVAGLFDPEIRELDAIQAEGARSKRQPGEGAVSDFDAQQYLAMTYGKDKPTATNKALIQAQRVGNDAAIQKRQFAEWHYNTYGTLSGAEEAWDRYAQDNPIFDPRSEATGAPKLNPGRKAWRDYFGVSRSPGDSRPTQAAQDLSVKGPPATAPKKDYSKATKAQINAAQPFRGSKEPSGRQGNPYLPVSAQEFDKLPVGSWFINPADGRVLQKGR